MVGGAVIVFVNVAASPSGPRADPTGMMARAFVPDSPPGAGWLVVGFALAGLGLAGLYG